MENTLEDWQVVKKRRNAIHAGFLGNGEDGTGPKDEKIEECSSHRTKYYLHNKICDGVAFVTNLYREVFEFPPLRHYPLLCKLTNVKLVQSSWMNSSSSPIVSWPQVVHATYGKKYGQEKSPDSM